MNKVTKKHKRGNSPKTCGCCQSWKRDRRTCVGTCPHQDGMTAEWMSGCQHWGKKRGGVVRYVTYYYSFLGGLSDVTVHPDKDSAVRFYRREAVRYFDVRLPRKTETPNACGFPHRRFGIMSIRLFRKNFPEWKGGAS